MILFSRLDYVTIDTDNIMFIVKKISKRNDIRIEKKNEFINKLHMGKNFHPNTSFLFYLYNTYKNSIITFYFLLTILMAPDILLILYLMINMTY